MNRKKLIASAAAAVVTSLLLVGCEDVVSDAVGSGSKETQKSTYEVKENVTSIDLDNKGGDIQLTASATKVVKVTEEVSFSSDQPKTEHSVSGSELRLTSGSCDSGNCKVSYRIELPSNVAVKIATDGGDVKGKGLGGDVELNTEGGDVQLVFAAAPKSIDASTAGGNVDLTVPSGAYAVDVSTDGGNRTVDVKTEGGAPNSITARTDGGDVTVKPAA